MSSHVTLRNRFILLDTAATAHGNSRDNNRYCIQVIDWLIDWLNDRDELSCDAAAGHWTDLDAIMAVVKQLTSANATQDGVNSVINDIVSTDWRQRVALYTLHIISVTLTDVLDYTTGVNRMRRWLLRRVTSSAFCTNVQSNYQPEQCL